MFSSSFNLWASFIYFFTHHPAVPRFVLFEDTGEDQTGLLFLFSIAINRNDYSTPGNLTSEILRALPSTLIKVSLRLLLSLFQLWELNENRKQMHEHPHFFSVPKVRERRTGLEGGHVLIWLWHHASLRGDAVRSQNAVEGQGAELAENKGWRATQLSFFKYVFIDFF